MPQYRKPQEEIDDLPLPSQPECIVKMRRRGVTGDRYDAEDYILQHRVTHPNGQADPLKLGSTWTVALWELLTLALITDWNLESEGGEKWPFTVESLRRLDPIDGTFLETEARKRMDGPDGPFGSTLVQPSRVTRSRIRSSDEPSSSTSSPDNSDGRLPSSAESAQTTLTS